MRALLALALALAGCITVAPPPAPTPADAHAEALALAVPACVPLHAPFTVTVRLRDASGAGGRVDVAVVAQQYGRIVADGVTLAPGETRDASFSARIDAAGPWDAYVTQPSGSATQQRVRVVDATSC